MIKKRFTIKPQDDYFGVTDNYSADKVNVVNGIRTEIEAEWLCELLNELHDEVKSQSLVIKGYQERTEKLFNENEQLKDALNQRTDQCDKYYKENEQLKSFIKGTCIFCGANLRQQYIEKYGDIE